MGECDPERLRSAVRRARSPSAIAALAYLARWGRATAAELAEAAGIPSTRGNSTLRPYIEAGVVEVMRVGGRVIYSVSGCAPRSLLLEELRRVARRRGLTDPHGHDLAGDGLNDDGAAVG